MAGGGPAGGALASVGLATAKKNATAQTTTGGAASLIGDTAGTLEGTLSNLVASVSGGVLTIAGTFTGAAGGVLNFAAPIDLTQATGSCQILNLVLGPLDLSVLGLNVHLDTVHLNITAQSGPGNLLGNLLCSVAHLLDNGGPLQGLAGLLNNLFRALGIA